MRYSHGMTTIDAKAPEIYPGYPYRRRVFPAWQAAWDLMRQGGDEYQDGKTLAGRVAARHGLAPGTMQAVLTRAANAGLLERETRAVKICMRSGDGPDRLHDSVRKRTFYRIKVQS